MANMDGIRPPRRVVREVRDVVAPRTRVRAAQQQVQRRAAVGQARQFGPGAAAAEARPLAKRRRWVEQGQWPLIAAVALVAAYSSTLGQYLILAYGLITLILRRDSREPFVAALIMLVTVPLFQILNLGTFENNAAIYAYELLVIGVIAAILQLKFQKLPRNVVE